MSLNDINTASPGEWGQAGPLAAAGAAEVTPLNFSLRRVSFCFLV